MTKKKTHFLMIAALAMLVSTGGAAKADMCDFPGSQLSLAELQYCAARAKRAVASSEEAVERARRAVQVLGGSTTQEVHTRPGRSAAAPSDGKSAAQDNPVPTVNFCGAGYRMAAGGCEPR